MQKETLTLENIRSDLRRQLWETIALTALCGTLLVIIFVSYSYESLASYSFKNAVKSVLLDAFFFAVVVRNCFRLYNIYSALHKPGRIVTERLREKKAIGDPDCNRDTRGPKRYASFYLRFAGYAKYRIPTTNYRWSYQYEMESKWVYLHAECGEEFYLVVSKPHTGRILLAYPAKIFTLQQTEEEKKV